MAYDNNKLGELRPNQIITTFGPGSIVDAVKHILLFLLIAGKELLNEIIRRKADKHVADIKHHDVDLIPRHLFIGEIKTDSLFHGSASCLSVSCNH